MKLYSPDVFIRVEERNLFREARATGFAIRHKKSKKFYHFYSPISSSDCYVKSVLGKTVHCAYVENFYQKLYPPVESTKPVPEIEWV